MCLGISIQPAQSMFAAAINAPPVNRLAKSRRMRWTFEKGMDTERPGQSKRSGVAIQRPSTACGQRGSMPRGLAALDHKGNRPVLAVPGPAGP